jgi:hypothetical protein
MDSFETVNKNAGLARSLSSSDINRRLSEEELLGRIEAATDFRRPKQPNYGRRLAVLASAAAVVVAVVTLSGNVQSTLDRGRNLAWNVRCYSTGSLDSASVVMPMRQTRTLGCHWNHSKDSVMGIRSISCVLNDGQVGVFPMRRRGSTCAMLGLPDFVPTPVPQPDALVGQLAEINNPTRCEHPDDLAAKAGITLGRFGVANWRIKTSDLDVCSMGVTDREKRQITIVARR